MEARSFILRSTRLNMSARHKDLRGMHFPGLLVALRILRIRHKAKSCDPASNEKGGRKWMKWVLSELGVSGERGVGGGGGGVTGSYVSSHCIGVL